MERIYINFQDSQVKYQTEKAVLLKVPRSSYKVWIPKSLVYRDSWFYKVLLPDNMAFTLMMGSRQAPIKKEVDAYGLREYFLHEALVPSQPKVVEHKAKRLKPKEVTVDDSLKR